MDLKPHELATILVCLQSVQNRTCQNPCLSSSKRSLLFIVIFQFADFLHSLYLQPAKIMIVQIIRNIKRGSKITLHSDHGSCSSSTFILSEVSIVSVTLLDLTVESENRSYKEYIEEAIRSIS